MRVDKVVSSCFIYQCPPGSVVAGRLPLPCKNAPCMMIQAGQLITTTRASQAAVADTGKPQMMAALSQQQADEACLPELLLLADGPMTPDASSASPCWQCLWATAKGLGPKLVCTLTGP